mgnify:CR=1 FL=1
MSHVPSTNDSVAKQSSSIVGLALRVFWMFLGNLGLAACLLSIIQRPSSVIWWRDAAYAALVFLLIGSRYMEVRFFQGTTAYGEPASVSDWRRYTLWLCIGAGIAWAGAHGIAYLLPS